MEMNVPIDISVPEMAESVFEATVGRWIRRPGSEVKFGETLLELETDKVNMEIPSPADGVLEKIMKQSGETVVRGDVLGIISQTAKKEPEPLDTSTEETNFVSVDQPLLAAQSSINGNRASEPPSATPLARKTANNLGIDLSQVMGTGTQGKITVADVEKAVAKRVLETKTETESENSSENPALSKDLTSSAWKEASSNEDISELNSDTPGDATSSFSLDEEEIVSSDSGNTQDEETTDFTVASDKPEPDAAVVPEEGGKLDKGERRQRLTRRQITMAQRLSEIQAEAVMTTTYNEVDMSAVIDLRKRYKAEFEIQHDVRLGMMSFIVKAACVSLEDHPVLNAELDEDEIVYKTDKHIGVAVATQEGLVVPVVRSADSKTLAQIEKEIRSLAERARDKTLVLEDLRGGTFTITNGGVFGSMLSTPILNPPQTGILGMHAIKDRPVATESGIEVRPIMYLALTYDHRIVEGADAVQCLARIKQLLESPERFLLNL